MQTGRCLRIMRELARSPEGMTADELGALYGCTGRQARRDLKALRDMGLRIEGEQGRYTIDTAHLRRWLGL